MAPAAGTQSQERNSIRRCRPERQPSAQEQGSGHGADRDHVRIFGHEECRKLHAAVFGMISRDQLVLSFRQIERDAVGFREGRDQKNDETEDLRHGRLEDAPVRDESQIISCLVFHDLAQAKGIRQQQRRRHRHAQRQFVADHLRRTAQSAHQRILIVRSPTRECDSIHAYRRNRQHEQDADIQIRQLHPGAVAEQVNFGRQTESPKSTAAPW